MSHQPVSAGSAERELIESMLFRQQQVLTELDDLFGRIDSVIAEISEQRKTEETSELAELLGPDGQTLPFEPASDSPTAVKRAA